MKNRPHLDPACKCKSCGEYDLILQEASKRAYSSLLDQLASATDCQCAICKDPVTAAYMYRKLFDGLEKGGKNTP